MSAEKDWGGEAEQDICYLPDLFWFGNARTKTLVDVKLGKNGQLGRYHG